MAEENIELVKGMKLEIFCVYNCFSGTARPEGLSWCHKLLGNGCLASTISIPGMPEHALSFVSLLTIAMYAAAAIISSLAKFQALLASSSGLR